MTSLSPIASSLFAPKSSNTAQSSAAPQRSFSDLVEAVAKASEDAIARTNQPVGKSSAAARDPKAEFADFLGKDSAELWREQILRQLGLTEEAIAAMPAEEQRAIEDKIAQMIEDKIREAAEESLEKAAMPDSQDETAI